MTAFFTGEEILAVAGGRIARGTAGQVPGRLVWDLNDITEGDWFVALAKGGEDSHDSLTVAIELGAQGCIVKDRSRYCFAPPGANLIAVADTRIALLELGRHWRDTVCKNVVTITGTVGRKDTARFIEFLLRSTYRCHIAFEQGDMGYLTDLLSMPADTELLIVEVSGVDRGDISGAASYLQPDMAVITSIHHPIPSPRRDARVAALNCEILETIKDDGNGMAIVYDRNPEVQERARLLMKGVNAVYFSEDTLSLSKSGLTWLSTESGLSRYEAEIEANAWCAVAASVCLGFSLAENPHIVSEVVVNAG